MNISQLLMVHEACAENAWVEAANLGFVAEESDVRVSRAAEALIALRALESNLIDQNLFLEHATLVWGNNMFDGRPSTVRAVFEAINETNKLIIIGGSSLSKTFSAGVRFYQDWRHDPYFTAVKIAAPNETALYTNLFSHLCSLHRASVIPMTDDDAKKVLINETEMTIAMHDALPEMRIQGILCKQNQVSAGALRGHKPKPRPGKPHPKYGSSTRLRILIDEGSAVSPGAFEDIKTTEASIDGLETVKIAIALNPEEVSSKAVQLAEPEGGWSPDQVDTLYRWKSAKGYDVLRLDGAKFENVVQRKVIYPRMVTYEAALDYLKAGEHSAAYWAKFRGFPPLQDNAHTIVPPAWMQSQRGEAIYTGTVINIAIVDTALQGSDKALMGIFRWGEAGGWTNLNGEVKWFMDRTNPTERRGKYVLTFDQIFQLPKSSSTVEIIQNVMGRCKGLGIPAENVGMDKTGNAAGVWSHAKSYWGDVLGIDFGTKASEDKVLAEDLQGAYDIYDGKVSELWFAFKRWIDPVVGAVLINPIVPTQPLFRQITSRRYRPVKAGRVRVEPKPEYRARNMGESPDEADLLCMAVEFVRQRYDVIPGVQEKRSSDREDSRRVSIENADDEPGMSNAEWTENRLDPVHEE